jgi:hypothetical protein
MEFVAASPQWTTTEKEAVFYLKATGATVSGLHCWIGSLNPERGDPGPRDSFECKAPENLAPGPVGELSLKLSPTSVLKRGTYSAVLQVLGTDQSGTAVSQTLAFKVIVPAVTLKVGEADTIRIRMIRYLPFSAATATIPIGIRVTSDLVPKRLPEAVATQLYVQDGDAKDIVPDGSLKAYFCDSKAQNTPTSSSKDLKAKRRWWSFNNAAGTICTETTAVVPGTETQGLEGRVFQVEPSVPSSVQKASGVLRLRSPEFTSDIETSFTLLVKDWWPYAALVVFLGQLLSFWVNNWITVGRQQKLNQSDAADIERSLVRLLIRRPDLESGQEIATVSTRLDSAAQDNKLGEVERAKQSIKEAKDKLDQFTSNLPAPQSPSGAPAIVMLQQNRSYPARRLNFVISNPDPKWTGNSVYKWEWSGQRSTYKELFTRAEEKTFKELSKEYLDKQQWRTLYEAQDLKNISTMFWKTGQYILRVSVDSAQAAVLPFRLEKDQGLSFLSRISISDKAILLLAVVFAAILSYLAIDKLEKFGSISDYALAFLGGFGLNATTSGFSAVISRFKVG